MPFVKIFLNVDLISCGFWKVFRVNFPYSFTVYNVVQVGYNVKVWTTLGLNFLRNMVKVGTDSIMIVQELFSRRRTK